MISGRSLHDSLALQGDIASNKVAMLPIRRNVCWHFVYLHLLFQKYLLQPWHILLLLDLALAQPSWVGATLRVFLVIGHNSRPRTGHLSTV